MYKHANSLERVGQMRGNWNPRPMVNVQRVAAVLCRLSDGLFGFSRGKWKYRQCKQEGIPLMKCENIVAFETEEVTRDFYDLLKKADVK